MTYNASEEQRQRLRSKKLRHEHSPGRQPPQQLLSHLGSGKNAFQGSSSVGSRGLISGDAFKQCGQGCTRLFTQTDAPAQPGPQILWLLGRALQGPVWF
ncbi:hypothetical protein GCM10027027_17290 [Neomicrococcus lactis]